MGFSSQSFRFLLFSFLVAGPVVQAQTKVEFLPLVPIGLRPNGDIISHFDSNKLFYWDQAQKKQVELTPPLNPSDRRMAFLTSVSFDSNRMMMLRNSILAPFQKITFFDFEQPEPAIPFTESRRLNAPPSFSGDGQSIVYTGRADGSTGTATHLWSMPLAEFLSDTLNGIAQPTGYYLTTVHQEKDALPDPDRLFPIERTWLGSTVLSPDASRVAFLVTKNAVQELNVKSMVDGTTQSSRLTGMAGRMEWPEGNYIYIHQASSALGTIRVHLQTMKSEVVTQGNVDATSASVSPDGKWFIVGRNPVVSQPRAELELIDLETDEVVKLKGVSHAKFAGDSRTVVFTRAKQEVPVGSSPFWVGDVHKILAAKKDKQVDMEALSSELLAAGTGIEVKPMPADAAAFRKAFEWQPAQVRVAPNFVSVTAVLKNNSSDHYGFKFSNFQNTACTVKDDQDVVVGKSNVPAVAGPTIIRLAPGETQTFFCHMTIPAPVNSGVKGIVTMDLRGYEGIAPVDVPVTF